MAHTAIPRSVRYTWEQDSQIGRLEAELDNDGYYVVRLFPGNTKADGALADVPAVLKRCGVRDAYPDVKDGQDVLVMANVKSLDKVVQTLAGAGFVSGQPNVEYLKKEEDTPGTDKVDTVKWHGRVGLVGHASILAAGLIQKPFDMGRIINAPLGAVNPLLMSWLGSGKDNVDVPRLMRDMREFFAKEGIALPPLSGEEQQRGFYETAKHFLAAHPIEVGSSLGVMGSIGMIKSGINGIKAKGSGWSRISLGMVNIVRDSIAVFVPEKKKKDSDIEAIQGNWYDSMTKLPGKLGHLATHPSDIPNATWDFISEAPLRMVGILSLVSDVLYAADAADAWKKNKLFRDDAYEYGGKFNGKAIRGRQQVLRDAEESQKKVSELSTQFHKNGDTDAYKNMLKERAKWDSFDNEARAMKNNQIMAGYLLDKDGKGYASNEFKDKWRGQVTPYLGATTALAFLGAGVLMTISSKEHKGDDVGAEALFSRLCTINAKIVAAFPEEYRDAMVQRLTSYMHFRTDITGNKFNAARFETEVRDRISHMQHNPWIDRMAQQPQMPTQSGIGMA